MDLYLRNKNTLDTYNINTKLRLIHFFAQWHAENNLKLTRESLYYKTVESARNTFKTPFNKKTDKFVSSYLNNSEKMANYVYANRMGNGDEKSGDGFLFRGGGGFQITGFDNYYELSIDTGIDYVYDPNIITNEFEGIISMCWYWNKNNLNKWADLDNLDAVSDIINIGKITKAIGDSNGYNHRLKWYNHYKTVFK